MGVYDLKQAFADFPGIDQLTIEHRGSGRQVINIGGRTVEIRPMATNDDIALALTNPWMREDKMSISGYEPGSIKAKLEALKQKARDARTAALSKLDEAGSKHEAVNAEIDRIAAQINKEADDALQEFATFTNGGPV